MKKFGKIILILLLMLPISLKALTLEGMNSSSVLVRDLDENKTLYEKGTSNVMPIASLTKIMTAVVSLEKIKDLDEKITITYEMLENVPWDASTAHLSAYDTVTYRDLLYGIMLPSGADAADSLAVSLYGSRSEFVSQMNKKAKELKMTNTVYVDPTGYDEGNKSNIKDLEKLIEYAINIPNFMDIFSATDYTTTNNLTFKSMLSYYGKSLNYNFDDVVGNKTGYTDEAGLCLLAISKINDERILTITLNAPVDRSKTNHLVDLNNIYTEVKNNFNKVKLYSKDDTLYELKTKNAKEDSIEINIKEDLYKYIEGEYSKESLTITYDGIDNIKYNTEKDTKLGTVTIKYKDEVIKEIDVLLENELHFSLLKFVKNNIFIIILSIVALFIIYVSLYCKIKHKRIRIRRK